MAQKADAAADRACPNASVTGAFDGVDTILCQAIFARERSSYPLIVEPGKLGKSPPLSPEPQFVFVGANQMRQRREGVGFQPAADLRWERFDFFQCGG